MPAPEYPGPEQIEAAKAIVPDHAGKILEERDPGALIDLAELAERDPDFVAHVAGMMEQNPDEELVIDSARAAVRTYELVNRIN